MGFADEYFKAMKVARAPVLDASVRAFASMPVAEFIPRWYVMLHQIICATVPTLHAASLETRAPALLEPWEYRLLDFWRKKLEEETGHEDLLLSDLRRVGVGDDRTERFQVIPWIAEMVGRQDYLIHHVHPAVYLGFIGLLEGFPPTLEQIDAIQAASGFPPEAFSCARLHAKADIGHREELAKMLDAVPSELHAAIITNGQRCAALQCAALEHLSQQEN